MKNVTSLIKNLIQILTISLLLFLAIDFFVTWSFGARGFSKFFIYNPVEGRMNNPSFTGRFGSILEEFSGQVSIRNFGERASAESQCNEVNTQILFVGDSTTAGFEVDDEDTFVSLFNANCSELATIGINLGVRGHDTHAVIGTYLRTSSTFDHDAVIYLMTENDFTENVDPNAYHLMSERFGRRYEGIVIKPNHDFIFSLYADLRVFVGDRLSLTTFLLRHFQLIRNTYFSTASSKVINLENNTENVHKSYELIRKLSTLVMASNAKLYIIPYPKLANDDRDIDQKIKLLSDMIDEGLKEVLYLEEIDDLVKAVLDRDGRKLFEMRYTNDAHLSEYGHSVIATILTDVLRDHILVNK